MDLTDLKVILLDPLTKMIHHGRKHVRVINRPGMDPNRAYYVGDRSKYMPHQGKQEMARRKKNEEA